jgi:hypothetical protein
VNHDHINQQVTNRVVFGKSNSHAFKSPTQPIDWQMPERINLDSSGLWHSSRTAVLSRRDKVYSHSTTSIKKLKQSSIHACLVLFSLFGAIGSGLGCGINSGQVVAASLSILSNILDSYHRVNSLYDRTINCFSPWTKHIAIKYHHFWKHVKTHSNLDGFIEIQYCATEDQVADIFTKPVWDDISLRL